eukprot:SAG11_NODE_2391_length_3412_cov_1.952309_3_plen_227_part_00
MRHTLRTPKVAQRVDLVSVVADGAWCPKPWSLILKGLSSRLRQCVELLFGSMHVALSIVTSRVGDPPLGMLQILCSPGTCFDYPRFSIQHSLLLVSFVCFRNILVSSKSHSPGFRSGGARCVLIDFGMPSLNFRTRLSHDLALFDLRLVIRTCMQHTRRPGKSLDACRLGQHNYSSMCSTRVYHFSHCMVTDLRRNGFIARLVPGSIDLRNVGTTRGPMCQLEDFF